MNIWIIFGWVKFDIYSDLKNLKFRCTNFKSISLKLCFFAVGFTRKVLAFCIISHWAGSVGIVYVCCRLNLVVWFVIL